MKTRILVGFLLLLGLPACSPPPTSGPCTTAGPILSGNPAVLYCFNEPVLSNAVQDTAPPPGSASPDKALVYDSSGNQGFLDPVPDLGNHGPAQDPGTPNGSLYFYGPYLEAPDSPDFTPTGNATFLAWVRVVGCGSGFIASLIDKYDPQSQTGYAVWLDQSGGQAIPKVQIGANTFTASGGFPANATVNSGIWHLLAVVVGGGSLTFYIDGNPAGSFPLGSVNAANNLSVLIGKSRLPNTNTLCEFAMAGLGLYHQPLSPASINNIYNLGVGVF
ncbi:LamG-like jellyroll fold domain-containing protein [Meiothermus rufus]|uniref:LamG-like jellyroll fold domain-containing protein n=1 Tax=Meiothermus rufus TaxID=604332 RepID=UPI0006841627|nr:LamG-like jellyroll fold domain-containing protein [Meiothermus rufus]